MVLFILLEEYKMEEIGDHSLPGIIIINNTRSIIYMMEEDKQKNLSLLTKFTINTFSIKDTT